MHKHRFCLMLITTLLVSLVLPLVVSQAGVPMNGDYTFSGAINAATDTGTANAYVITLVPALPAYRTGTFYAFKAANANTTTSTLRINGLTTITLKVFRSGALSNLLANDIGVGQYVVCYFDGTNCVVTSQLGAISGGVTSITGTANQITASASTGAVVLSTPQEIHTLATPRFSSLGLGGAAGASNTLKIYGTSSGSITVAVPAVAGSNTLTLPAGTTNFSATGGTSQVVKQTSAGAAFTVARLACADLSDSASGCTGTVYGAPGVTCDGVTDDSTALNSAIATVAAAGGGVIQLPKGTCIAHGITMGLRTGLRGVSRSGTTLKPAANGQSVVGGVFGVATELYASIQDLTISAGAFTGVTGIGFTLAGGVYVQNVDVFGCQFSLDFDRTNFTTITNVNSFGNASLGAGGLRFRSTDDANYIRNTSLTNVTVSNLGTGVQATALYVRRAVAFYVTNLNTNDLSTGGTQRSGIIVENDTQGFFLDGAIIVASTIGVLLQTGTGVAVEPSYNTFLNIGVDNAATAGIRVSSGYGTTFSGGNTVGSTIGIDLQGGRQTSIQNMKLSAFIAAGGKAVNIANGVSQALIANNVFADNATCINLVGTMTNVSVHGNHFNSCTAVVTGTRTGTGNAWYGNVGDAYTLMPGLSVAAGKTLTSSNTLTLAGTDGAAITFPNAGADTAAMLGTANTFTANQVISSPSTLTATSLATTGTAGAGFAGFVAQSSAPSAPASGYRAYADATGRFAWIRAADGFTRTWDATLTANRVYTLPDAAGTVLLDSATQTVTGKSIAASQITAGTFAGAMTLYAGGSFSTPAMVSAKAGNNIRFGSSNTAFFSTLGNNDINGSGFLAFNAENSSTSGVFRNDASGTVKGMYFGYNGIVFTLNFNSVTTASADFTGTVMGFELTPAGNLRAPIDFQVGAPTGGAKGTGTINAAGAYYANGTVGVSAGSFGTVTAITAAGGILTQLTGSSDENLKDISGLYGRGLAELAEIRPIIFHWNSKSGFVRDKAMVGFSAQNVQAVIPEAVGTETWSDGRTWLTLNDRAILAASVNAINALASRVEHLEAVR